MPTGHLNAYCSTTDLYNTRHLLHKFLIDMQKGENFKTLACYNGKESERTVHECLIWKYLVLALIPGIQMRINNLVTKKKRYIHS